MSTDSPLLSSVSTNHDDAIVTGIGSASREDVDSIALRRMDAFAAMALTAAERAIADAGIVFSDCDMNRCGVVIASYSGGLESQIEQHRIMTQRGADRVSAFLIPKLIINSAAGHIAVQFGLRGPGLGLCDESATPDSAIQEGRRWIAAGLCDVVIAGVAECVPDRWLDGRVRNCSAETVVLERRSHAARRGVSIRSDR